MSFATVSPAKLHLIFYVFFLYCSLGYSQPTVTLSSDAGDITNDNPITVFVEFSEEVTGLEPADFEVTNGAIIGEIEFYSSRITFGGHGNEDGKFYSPVDIAVDESGFIYILDNALNKVQVFDENGAFVKSFGKSGNLPGEFNSPRAIALDDAGNVYVGSSAGRVEKFDNDGNYLITIGNGIYGQEEGDFASTNQIVLDQDQNIYVLDASNYRVQVFNSDGNFLRTFGERDENPESFYTVPRVMSIDSKDNIYVGFRNLYNTRVNIYDNMGNYINYRSLPSTTWGSHFSSDITDVFIDQNGYMFASMYLNIFDVSYNRVNIYDEQGQLINYSGMSQIKKPLSVAVDSKDRVIVTSGQYDHVVVFEQKHYSQKVHVRPNLEGDVSIKLPQNVVDGDNSESNLLEFKFDETEPITTVTTSTPNVTDMYPFTIDVEFSEPVKKFTEDDIELEGYVKMEITGVEDSYQVLIWPKGNNSYNIKVPGLQVQDLAGNYSDASNTISIDFETTVPEVTLSTSEVSPTSSEEITIDVAFSEPVTNLDQYDFTISNGVVKNFDCTSIDTVEFVQLIIEPLYDNLVSVYLNEDSFYSLSGNGTVASNQIDLVYDAENPHVFFENEMRSDYLTTNQSPIRLYAYFNEEIFGLELEDFNVVGATLNSLTEYTKRLYPGTVAYELELVPTNDGVISIDLPEKTVTDQLGKDNVDSEVYELEYSTSPVKVELKTNFDLYQTDSNIIEVDFVFDKDIDSNSFTYSDIAVTGARFLSISGSGNSYEVRLRSEISAGEITVSLPEATVIDVFGNNNSASDELIIDYDSAPMSASLSEKSGSSILGESVIVLDLEFSRPVFGLSEKSFITTNCLIKSLDGSTSTYKVTVESVVEEGQLEVLLKRGAASDINNIGIPELWYDVIIDSSEPNIYISSPVSSPTYEKVIPITITMDDPVFDFQVDPISCIIYDDLCFTERDIQVDGGTISNFKGSGGYYTCDLTPINKEVELVIEANAAFNITDAGNSKRAILKIEYLDGIVLGSNDELDRNESIKVWVDSDRMLHTLDESGDILRKIQLMDHSGKLILSTSHNSNHWKFDASHLKSGVFILAVENRNTVQRIKLLLSNY